MGRSRNVVARLVEEHLTGVMFDQHVAAMTGPGETDGERIAWEDDQQLLDVRPRPPGATNPLHVTV